MDYTYTYLILLLPFLSFLFLGLAGKWLSHRTAGLIGTLILGTVAALSYYTAFEYFTADRVNGVLQTLVPYNFTWLPFYNEGLHFDIGIMLDPISVMMLIVISTVSLMVHIYSFGYMHGERGFQRYYAFLGLFTMSMLGLVLATNIFQMYLFWELVGVCSYLLIGFYYTQAPAVAASKKAFIVTRFADLGFLIGILIYGYYTGSFSFDFTNTAVYLNGAAPSVGAGFSKAIAGAGFILPTALFLMFIGGAGKSAMFPLHIWLPDAMEGPTPVSALIHAATMVVAGVFQVARMFPLWIQYAPDTLHIIAWIGAFTAFYAAAVACAQSDIKRVLAFSTISQIAFMMVALGVCLPEGSFTDNHASLGYMASMYHLFTHAMFKATLFLCAGCIIHAVHSNEMAFMGGMHKYMPITHITFLIACLAISGIPPFSGFYSKDEILVAAFQYSTALGWIMTGIAAMTAFYMFRLYFGIFWGTENKAYHEEHKPHESPAVMTIPLIFLTLITLTVGWILPGTFGNYVSATGKAYHIDIEMSVAITSVIIAIISIALAAWIYARSSQPIADRLQAAMPRLHKWAYHRFYIDEIYQFVTHRIIFAHISRPIAWFDRHVVDGFFNFLAWGTNATSYQIRTLQSGRVQQYAFVFLLGTLILILMLIL
ncbi:MAG: NADH-quinone oxidoreductase subunit L [Bacteroidaceae bacterium]|jgi:NADH-quinone oxidoreductase subunit L